VNYFEIDLLKKYYNISSESNKEGLDLSKFWLVYDIIKNNYFDADKINKEDLEEFAVSGLVK
jgi:hypothetical protein